MVVNESGHSPRIMVNNEFTTIKKEKDKQIEQFKESIRLLNEKLNSNQLRPEEEAGSRKKVQLTVEIPKKNTCRRSSSSIAK